MGRSIRLVACVFAMGGAAIVMASRVDAATTYPNLTVNPGGGQAGATFSATYTVRAGTGCAANTIVVIRWNAPNGAQLGALASSGSCSTTFNGTLRPSSGVMPGKYTLWALRTSSAGKELNGTSTRASVSYAVNIPPSPPPPSPPPPKPTPTTAPTPTRAPLPTPKPASTTAAATNHPTPAPITVALKPAAPPPPVAATTKDAPPAPVPAQAAAVSVSPPACKAAACPALPHAASSPSIVALVQSLVNRSPLPVLGTVLLVVAAVLYTVLRWTEVPRPPIRAMAVAPHAPGPLALDPVVPDPAQREIYRPPAPEPLPRDLAVPLPPPARSQAAGKREATTAAAATRQTAQATEDILPLALFPPVAGETGGTPS